MAANSFDLTIGNVPFGKTALHDKVHNAGRTQRCTTTSSSNRSRLTRPGGVVAVLTSRWTMDAPNPAARREMAKLADLVGAIRLPGSAHERAAGTGVVTDLLVLRRREPGRDPDPTAWEQARMTELDGAQVPVNEYFHDHPEMVLGTLGAVGGAYRADDLTVTSAGDTVAALTVAWTASPRRPAPAASPGQCPRTGHHRAEAPASQHPDGYLETRSDGTFTEVADGAAQPFEVPAPRPLSCAHCCGSATPPLRCCRLRPAHRKTPLIPNASAVS